jgi:hypothetical protein
VQIGGHLFRSTTDVDSLSPDEAKAVTEIAQMLFVQGDLRVRSASYAIIPLMEIYGQSDGLTQLVHVRAVLSYFYASPHDVFGEILLHPQETSLMLFVPSPFRVFLTLPEHHTSNSARCLSAVRIATEEQYISTSVTQILILARPERFELPTTWFEARCSIQLSYGRRARSVAVKRIF